MLNEMNDGIGLFGVKFGIREEYAIEYPKADMQSGDEYIVKRLNSGSMTALRNTLQG